MPATCDFISQDLPKSTTGTGTMSTYLHRVPKIHVVYPALFRSDGKVKFRPKHRQVSRKEQRRENKLRRQIRGRCNLTTAQAICSGVALIIAFVGGTALLTYLMLGLTGPNGD